VGTLDGSLPHNGCMLRNPGLIPLSRQHQHALALCVRIERALPAGSVDLNGWQREIEQHYAQEIRFHFEAEEELLFPAANRLAELKPLVEDLRAEHRRLREIFGRAGKRKLNESALREFAALLSGHIRKEERQLFEALQKRLGTEKMNSLGEKLARALAGAGRSCVLPQTRMPTKPG
jgi:hemerythrin-like domain-containing protein